MQITMNDSRITSIAQLRDFLKGVEQIPFSLEQESIEKKYEFINKTLKRFLYRRLSIKDKNIIPYHRIHPHKIYTSFAIKLLEKTDEAHLRLSEDATKEILRREYEVFGKKDYQTISHISHGHITNLRHSPIYKNSWINHTKARQTPIGETRPPHNFGRPGSIRIDSVSQKDVYHINSLDEITQWEVVFCVPQLSESCMLPA